MALPPDFQLTRNGRPLVPRPFQPVAIDKLRYNFAHFSHRRQIVHAPTGSGKTILAMMLIAAGLMKDSPVLFIADRITLIDQTSRTAFELGLTEHGIIQADHYLTDYSKKFQIGSAQTLARRGFPKAKLIVVDEAHTQYQEVVDHIMGVGDDVSVVGLTATPFTKGLGKVWQCVINATTMKELVDTGVLVPRRVFVAERIDMKGAKTVGGEWSDRAVEQRGLKIVGDVVKEWRGRGENRKTICFGATIAHCEEMCRAFNEAGVMARVFTARTPDAEREEILREFRKPNSVIRMLISVEALAKGFDVPDVGCIIDCRPLRKSFSTYVQIQGRGLRSSPETGKTDCIVLDHSGNALRFAEDWEKLYYDGVDSLDTGEKLDATVRKEPEGKEPRACPACGYTPFGRRCVSCGHEHIVRAGLQFVPGEMRELVLNGRFIAPNHFDLYAQVATYARNSSAPDKQRGRAAHLFKEFTGSFPPDSWQRQFAQLPIVPIQQAVASKIASLNIAYARGMAKHQPGNGRKTA